MQILSQSKNGDCGLSFTSFPDYLIHQVLCNSVLMGKTGMSWYVNVFWTINFHLNLICFGRILFCQQSSAGREAFSFIAETILCPVTAICIWGTSPQSSALFFLRSHFLKKFNSGGPTKDDTGPMWLLSFVPFRRCWGVPRRSCTPSLPRGWLRNASVLYFLRGGTCFAGVRTHLRCSCIPPPPPCRWPRLGPGSAKQAQGPFPTGGPSLTTQPWGNDSPQVFCIKMGVTTSQTVWGAVSKGAAKLKQTGGWSTARVGANDMERGGGA